MPEQDPFKIDTSAFDTGDLSLTPLPGEEVRNDTPSFGEDELSLVPLDPEQIQAPAQAQFQEEPVADVAPVAAAKTLTAEVAEPAQEEVSEKDALVDDKEAKPSTRELIDARDTELTDFYEKMKKGEVLTKDELMSLYTGKAVLSSQVREAADLIAQRAEKLNGLYEDIATMFDCTLDQVAVEPFGYDGIKQNTMVYVGNINSDVISNLERLGREIPVYKKFPGKAYTLAELKAESGMS